MVLEYPEMRSWLFFLWTIEDLSLVKTSTIEQIEPEKAYLELKKRYQTNPNIYSPKGEEQ